VISEIQKFYKGETKMKTMIRSFIGNMSRMSKLFLAAMTLAAVGAGPSESHAVNGTLSGCVTTTEVRTNPTPNNPGRLWTSQPGDGMPIRRALIRLRFFFGTEVFTITNDAGCYSIAWNDPLSLFFPVNAQLSVILASPDMPLGTQRTSQPNRLFTIHDGPLFGDFVAETRDVAMNANTTRNVTVSGTGTGEPRAAYMTTEEFYARVVRQSTAFLNTMKNVHVHVNSTPAAPGVAGGIAPTTSDVFLMGGTTAANAFVTAHELGHIVAWRSLGVVTVPFRADFQDFACDGTIIPAHSFNSVECQKAAWNEGFAHTVAAAWMWARNASSPVIPENGGFNLESGNCPTPSVGNECSHAKALWDIYDSRTGDDDGIGDRSMVSITQVLRGYPDFCIVPVVSDNRCSNEGDPLGLNSLDLNALNHLDFRGNWSAVLGATQIPQINAIYTQNSVTGGDNN
jgi:hypothetical protein